MGVDLTNYIIEVEMNQVESSSGEPKTFSRWDSIEENKVWNVREMRYAEPCGLIIPRVESSTLNMCDSDFYSCNM